MKSRSKVGRVLSMIALCCSIVYLLLRIFGILDNRMHFTYHAAAAETTSTTPALSIDPVPTPTWEGRQLTIEETIGLYGYYIDAIYTGIDMLDQYLHFELMGSYLQDNTYPGFSTDLRLWRDPNNPNGTSWGNLNVFWWTPALPNSSNATRFSDDVNDAPYVIYGCWIPPGLFHTINNLQNPNIRADIDFPFSIDCLYFDNHILFSRDTTQSHSGWSYTQKKSTTYFGYQSLKAPLNGGNGAQCLVTPYPENIDNETGISMGVIPNSVGDANSLYGEGFTLTGEMWTFNGCTAYFPYGTAAGGAWILAYVQCPFIVTGVELPLPTTTRPKPETTRADFTTPLFTYDLSPLETNQINQIRIQNEQLQVEYAQLNGINYICRRLDDIYNQMVRDGHIPVDLIPGSPVELYNSDVRNEINGILTSYTTSQFPDYEYEMDFVSRAFAFLWAEPWIAALGGLSLCFSVAAWIIFEGRRG